MRPSAIIPLVCCTAALILSFLCLFAGQKKDFMEDYHLLTLNTSRIGTNLLNTSDSGDSSNPFSTLFHNISNSIENEINEFAGDVAEALGIDDFYSAHILDYCYGDYTPTNLPNATISSSDIHKNVSGCSNMTAMYSFNPTEVLERALNESGVDVTLADLDWPADIQKGIDALRIISKTVFVLYCIGIALIFISLVAAVPALFSAGRMAACLNVMVSTLALLAIGIASALVTAVIVKAADTVNKYGNEIGVEAQKGGKFLALTWAATALMFVTLCVWTFETCCGHRRRERRGEGAYVAKHG
ncbi:integral membrane protein-like protein [Melanomma pulvis-pyrius CBS 109.77]|uniref:Integral membrane protein-like protein n=1 Tax=Melanomma pulvis-pyrius CBS 109.77 TaxID=1314802 RepID=A0A6A6WRR7_9PLEO|nr:integral membrane protein-like protein [Melanomma pulvis-pyrius CBS 109.77]